MGIFWFLCSSYRQCTMLSMLKRAKQRRTKAREKRQEKEQRSRASLKGAELKQAEAKASNEPANQPVSQLASYPDGRLLTVKP